MTAPTPAAPAAPDTTPADGPQVTATTPAGQAPTDTPPPSGTPGLAAPVYQTPPPAAAPTAAPHGGEPAAAKRTLDGFPPEVRDYIAELRQEAAENRTRAKTAEKTAAEQFDRQRQEWVGNLLESLGLIDQAAADKAGTPEPPEQQIAKLTEQLGQRDTAHREARLELAIWKAAAEHSADPQRLTDSRAFMSSIVGLDPMGDDFGTQVEDAIRAAVDRDAYFKATPPAGQVPPPPPPVSHVGDFAGGPGGGDATPHDVDGFRALLKGDRKPRDGNY